MRLPLLLLAFVASSLGCLTKESQDQYTKKLRTSSTSGSISRLEKGRKNRQLSGIPKLKLDVCKGLIGSVSAIGHIVGNTVNCKEVLEKAARTKRKSRRKHRRRRPHKKPVEVSNFIEEPEEVVYYEESFPGEFEDGVGVDYEETSFDEQSFFSSSEKPDFNPTIPEFTSKKFYEAATTTEGGFGQSHSDHGHPLAHDTSLHTQTHFHSDAAQDTTLQPFQHEINHANSEEFTIKPFSHNSFNGVKWTPSSPDPNADGWTTSSPVQGLRSNNEDTFVSWTTASPPSAKRVWTTFAPQRVTTKQAVAPAPTDQTQPLVGEFQVTSNPWPSQFTSDVLKQVGKLSANKGASKTFFASPTPHTIRDKKNVQPLAKFPSSFFASSTPNSAAGETATEIAPFPNSFFASPTPENSRLKKEIEVSNYPKSFTNLGRQPSSNNHYAKPKISFEKAQIGALNDGSAAFKETFFSSPQEDDIVDLLIPDPLSPGHPQGNGNHGWAPLEELAQAQRESFLKTGGSWDDPFKKSPKRQTHKKPLPVTTSTIQDWKKKSYVNTQAIKAQWESALQRELPDSRSESLDHSQERKWVQPAKKGDNEDTVSSWVKKPTQESSWQQTTTKPTSSWVKPTTKPVSFWESPTPKLSSQWELQPTEKPTWTKSAASPTSKWAADWVQPYSPVPKAWQKRELDSGAKTVSPTTTTTKETPSKSISSIQEWAQTPLEKFAEIPSFESMRSTPRKTITLINKWQGPTTTTSAPRTVSYSPVTKPSAIRSFPESFPGTSSRSTYDSPYNTYESDADLSHLIGPTGAPGIAYIHTDAPKTYHPSPKTAQQLQQLGQINVNSNSHYMAQNPFLVNQESPASTAHSNIFLGTPVPTVGSVKRNINQNDYWTYNPTTERSVVKTYSPFHNSIWEPPSVSEASNPKISVALPNVEPKSSKEVNEEEEELRPHETASKITGYSYKSVNFPGSGESEGYNSFHYTTS